MKEKLVGVIGGLGPKATTYFMNIVIDNTESECDQDNVDMIVCQTSSTPDRTAFILDETKENPLPKMISSAVLLEKMGCDFIVMPCNTACYFYDEIDKNIHIPFYNIVKETLNECKKNNSHKIGLMATDGTLKSGVYQDYLDFDATLFTPSEEMQKKIMGIIYDYVKKNKPVNEEDFLSIINYFKNNGCDRIVMGCTELSVVLKDLAIKDSTITDSLTVLAFKTIEESGKKIKNKIY